MLILLGITLLGIYNQNTVSDILSVNMSGWMAG